MATAIRTIQQAKQPPLAHIQYPGSLERFEEFDSMQGVAAVPISASSAPIAILPLKQVDIVERLLWYFTMKTTTNAYTGTLNLSPYFPYNFVQKLKIPYQTGSLAVGDMDGHMWSIYSKLRRDNKGLAMAPYLLGEGAVQNYLYSAEANDISSSAAYTVAVSTAETYKFLLEIPVSLYFQKFYDLDMAGNRLLLEDCYVSPFLMASTARSSLPTLTLNPGAQTSKVDAGPFTQSGSAATLPTWTDGSSTVDVRREGWRQPARDADMPPIFNWQHTYDFRRVALTSSKVTIPLPAYGQLLCIVMRMFDPTLTSIAATIGDGIPLSNLTTLRVSYGSNIAKFDDVPYSVQARMVRQHGSFITKGCVFWDMYTLGGRTNLHAINTYDTAGPQIFLDFGANTPGANSYAELGLEYLTLVGS